MRLLLVVCLLLPAVSFNAGCGGVADGFWPIGEEPASAGAGADMASSAGAGGEGSRALTDAEVRQLVINDSIAAYEGNRPCP